MSVVTAKPVELVRAVQALAPPLSFRFHKGEAGRIGIIGGSAEYTGAPYFSAITALKSGADLSHVFCQEGAASAIKSYSPDLIVHPILSEASGVSCSAISEWLPRLHSLVIGPGLGRNPKILSTVKMVIDEAKSHDKDIVIDADGLYLVQEDPSIVIGYRNAVLSPNAVEFNRLFEKMFGLSPDILKSSVVEQTRLLAEKMGGVTILRKGQVDVISNGIQSITCDEAGSPRRAGGQGDILSGAIGLFLFWARLADTRVTDIYPIPLPLIACYTGCLVVKKCAIQAYDKLGRSMLTSDMLNELPSVIKELF